MAFQSASVDETEDPTISCVVGSAEKTRRGKVVTKKQQATASILPRPPGRPALVILMMKSPRPRRMPPASRWYSDSLRRFQIKGERHGSR